MIESAEQNEVGPIAKELQDRIVSEVEKLLNEDRAPRDTMIRLAKKLELYFKGYQRLFWSERLGDWSAPGLPNFDPQEFADKIDPGELELVPKIVNFYRAFGETVIAALSSGIPYVKFFPGDADDFDDLITARAYRKLADKIERDNEIETLFVHALWILWNQHFVAFYNYAHQCDEYGFNKKPMFGMVEKQTAVQTCPNCQEETEEQINPEDQSVQNICPNCGPVQSQLETKTEYINEQTGTEDVAKVREILECYGILNVAVPSYIYDVKSTPYLVLETEIHESLAQELVLTDPDLDEETKLDLVRRIKGTNQYQTYERWGRTPLEYYGSDSRLVTVRRVWLRPWTFNLLGIEDEEAQNLKAQFPKGALITLMNRIFIKAKEENLDEHWTISKSPLSATVHASPLGMPAQDIQDMKNDLVNIELQTCQFGITETFADPEVVDFRAFQKLKSQPGMMTPAKPKMGMTLDQAFHTIKPAVLGQEVPTFENRLEQDGQFVTGALPSVFGGSIEGGSKTLGEYEKSGSQALQRLSLTWKMLNNTYRKAVAKAVKEYRDNLEFDEKFVTKHGSSFINIWIKLDELTGNVGDVISESSEQFPMSWKQKQDAILGFLNLKDPTLSNVIYDPNNAQMIADYLGFSELYIPGADDRNVQLQEIKELEAGQAMENPPPIDLNTGQPQLGPDGQPLPPTFTPSVGIQPTIDNHQIHIAVCRAFLNSPSGRALLLTNKAAYDNIVAHEQMHEQYLQQQAMMNPPPPQEQEQANG